MLTNFFAIDSCATTETGYRAAVTLNPQHAIYQGHFPEQPIVPGVCTMHIVKRCLEEQLGQTLTFVRIAQCKYLAVIDPTKNDRLVVDFSYAPTDNGTQLTAEISADEAVVMRLKGELIPTINQEVV